MPRHKVEIEDTAKNPRYMLSLKYMVAGFPTAGGFPGYLRNGIKKKTKYIINERKTAFFISLENERNLRIKVYTIPRREP
jgi:hypothetical protein